MVPKWKSSRAECNTGAISIGSALVLLPVCRVSEEAHALTNRNVDREVNMVVYMSTRV